LSALDVERERFCRSRLILILSFAILDRERAAHALRARMPALQSRKMNLSKLTLSFFIVLVLLTGAPAQRRRTTPQPPAKPVATPTQAPQPTPAQPADPSSPAIAIVNDTTISGSDIQDDVNALVMRDSDPYLRDYYTDPAKAIREARQRAVDARVASLLVAAEAKKRGKDSNDLIQAEIDARIPAPTEEEIKAAYDANRDQIGSADLESVRIELINYIREQRRQNLYATMITRLKMTNVVSKGADVNAPNLASGTVLASVNGEPLRVEVINERIKAYVYKLDMRLFQIRQGVLDRRINDLLIVAEATKKKIGPEEIVRTEITDKLKTPTDAEVSKFYEDNKARIRGDLASNKAGIVTYLQQEQQEKLETALADRLRAGAKVQILLKEPDTPAINVALGIGASRGDVNSAVTVVEFTDFQCSACGGMYPIVEEVLKSYGTRVHFVIRNFPLTTVHPNAFNAAQAAEAAKAQGKFWEYIDLMFKNQNALDVDSLKKYATQVGLDRKRFDAELDSGKYIPIVRADLNDGDEYGVEATPTFFINGVILTDYSGEGLRAAIEKAFARAKKP
jgi:protein-disulfide isomerase